MFDGYRKLLKIVCSEKWNADENHKELDDFLNILEKTLGEKLDFSVLLNLLQKLLEKAFDKNDEDLLYLAINAIINLDEMLEKNGKKPEVKMEDKTELTVEKEKVSEEQIEKEKDETLSRDYGTLIKKSAIKEVLSKIKKDFSLNDLGKIITDYYHNVLKSKVEDKGMRTYINSYMRFLTDFGFCRRDDIPEYPLPKRSAVIYHLTGKDLNDLEEGGKLREAKKKTSRYSLSNKAQYIILWTEKNATDVVDVDAIYQHKLLHSIGENYRIKDIYAGLDELIEKGMATRFSKKRYGIKREMIKKE